MHFSVCPPPLRIGRSARVRKLMGTRTEVHVPDRTHPALNGEYSSASQSISWRTAVRSWSR